MSPLPLRLRHARRGPRRLTTPDAGGRCSTLSQTTDVAQAHMDDMTKARFKRRRRESFSMVSHRAACLLYTSDAADDM
eukprot:4225657-Alexandrium_andersonii.AAC.1